MEPTTKAPKTSVRVLAEFSQSIDVDIDEVFSYLDEDDLVAALERRARHRYGPNACTKLMLIYEEFARRKLEAPQVLKDYFYEMLGRIL